MKAMIALLPLFMVACGGPVGMVCATPIRLLAATTADPLKEHHDVQDVIVQVAAVFV